MNKKRYAGLLWTNPHKHDKMDSKGIETVSTGAGSRLEFGLHAGLYCISLCSTMQLARSA